MSKCLESCPTCKHKIKMELCDVKIPYESDLYEYEHYLLDCDYVKHIIINRFSECNGIFEEKVA